MLTFSDLLIFGEMYFPSAGRLMMPLTKAQDEVEHARLPLPEHPGRPGTIGSVDAMMAAAKARWAELGVGRCC